MKKIIGSLVFVIFGLFVLITPANAAPVAHESTGSELNPSICDTSGSPVINVTYRSINNYDSGFGGTAWANDSINRILKIYDQGENHYCAVVRDSGQFITFAGTSPLYTGINISAGITGTLEGGYIGTFDATALNPNPSFQTKGSLGQFDFNCTDAYTCPGAFNWPNEYFEGVTNFDQPYWAWNYRAGKNGTMVQSNTQYLGNILDN